MIEVLKWIARGLTPLILEHGPPMLREWWKARAEQSKRQDQWEQLAGAVEQLTEHARRVDSDLDTLNRAFTTNEDKLRKWVVALLIWNLALTLSLVLMVIFAIHR